MKRGALRRIGRDLGVGLIGFALILAVSYAVGRALLPASPGALGEIPVEPAVTTPDTGSELRSDLAAIGRPAAVVGATGEVEGRFVLDRVEYPWRFNPLRFDPDPESAVDIEVRFTGREAALRLIADGVAVGEERTEAMTVVLASGARTFIARAGMCTLEVVDAAWVTVTRSWGTTTLPEYAGQLTCRDVPELRSGELATFMAVFAVFPHEEDESR